MSETTETDIHAKHEPVVDRVGDIIRKERITRRIALETIAKDLKLNVKYIKALEANEYNALPAEPYIRVYFRSLAKYLMLDPEEILKQFYKEQGVTPEEYKKENTAKLTITMAEPDRSVKPWMIIAIVIVALAGISFIGRQAGWISSSPTEHSADGALAKQSSEKNMNAKADSVEDSLLGALIQHGETPAPEAGASTMSSSDNRTEAPVSAVRDAGASDTHKMSFEIKGLKDSVWIQIFCDGQSSKNYLFANKSRRYYAKDSFNIHVGNNSELKYYLNNKPLYIKAKNIAVFKITRGEAQPEMWTLVKWMSVFKDRL